MGVSVQGLSLVIDIRNQVSSRAQCSEGSWELAPPQSQRGLRVQSQARLLTDTLYPLTST